MVWVVEKKIFRYILNPNVAENLSSKRYRLGQQGAFAHFQGRKRIKHTVRS